MRLIANARRGAQKIACLFIVMLLVAPFQLHGLGWGKEERQKEQERVSEQSVSGQSVAPPQSLPKESNGTVAPSLNSATNPTQTVLPVTGSSTMPSDAPTGENTGNTAEDAEIEAINNILGAPVLAPTVKKPSPVVRVQKHVSLLDNSSGEDSPASNFDYGIYTANLRLLETYRQRVQEAIETARQLSLPVSNDVVNGLLKEAQAHKRQFEKLYPSRNEEESKQGLIEWEQARKALLHALALISPSPKVEGRAIWLDRGTIINAASPEGLRTLMQQLSHAGINIVYFETLNAGFPIYPSKILAPNPMVKGWDPLAVAIKEGNRLGMEVHAWVWVFAVGNRRHNPLIGMSDNYPGPILSNATMDDAALRNQAGGLSVDARQHEFWLSPASPKTRALLLSVYEEIVRHYEVAGIHLDYIRYPFQTTSTRMGYEAAGRNGFHKATGRTLDGPLDCDTLRLWTSWKTLQVNSFVQQVSTRLRRIRPNLQISAAVFPMRRAARLAAIQQDWETWINNGWVDTLSPMSYTTDPQRLQSLFESVRNSPQRHPLIYPGVALNRLDDGQLILQLEALREKGSLGCTLFAGAHLNADKEETLATGPYKQAQSLPPHRNIFESLASVLGDYRQSFDRVSKASTASAFSPEALQQMRLALDGLHTSLSTLQEGHAVPCGIPSERLQELQQHYQTLQEATQAWLANDREQNPLRARYFERTLYTFSELLDYLNDKNATASRIVPADIEEKAETPVSEESVSVSKTTLEPSEPSSPDAQPKIENPASSATPAPVPETSSPTAEDTSSSTLTEILSPCETENPPPASETPSPVAAP